MSKRSVKLMDARRALQFAWRQVIGGRDRPTVKASLAGLRSHLGVGGSELSVARAAHKAGLVSSRNMRSALAVDCDQPSGKVAPSEGVPAGASFSKGRVKLRGSGRRSRDDFYSSWEWTALRMKVLRVYGRRCQCCGATPEGGATIQVDHIKPRSKFPELELDFDNLQVLCSECNRGKSNKWTADFRPDALEREQAKWQAAVRELSDSHV